MFECKIGLETLYFTIENPPGSSKSNLTCEAGCGLRFHGRIMVGSFSDRPRIGNDVSSVFKDFVRKFAIQFCVAGAVFGEVGS